MNAPDMHMKLLKQPLFQGMSKSDIDNIIAHTKFGFYKYDDGERIVNEDDLCNQLLILTNGKVRMERRADDHGYTIAEELAAPELFQPERLFGLTQRFTFSLAAAGPCNLMTLDKDEILRLTDQYIIFRLNLLNIVATQTQRATHKWWKARPTSLRKRITAFVEQHCRKPAGAKVVYIKMERLAEEINENRLNVSRELNAMQASGLIQLRRGVIHVPSLEQLLRATQ